MYRGMTEVYYLFLIVMVSLGSSYMTYQLPALNTWFKRGLQRFKRKSPNVSPNDLDVRLTALEQQIKNIASRVSIREKNTKQQIRDEVKSYLEKLAK